MNTPTFPPSQDRSEALLFGAICLVLLALGLLAAAQFHQNEAMQSQLSLLQAQSAAHGGKSNDTPPEGVPPVLQKATAAVSEATRELNKPPISKAPISPVLTEPKPAVEAQNEMPIPPKEPQRVATAQLKFESLISADGGLLASNAEFSRTLGRRLFFHVKNGPPMGFDVDDLHPRVLQQLSLDAGQLKADQIALENARREATDALARQRHAHAESERERLEAWRQARLEQQKQFAVNADQQVALAALRTAEAAALRAQAVPPVIFVQQPAPVWTFPMIWTPVCPRPTPVPQVTPTPSFTGSSSFQFIQQRDNAFDPFVFGRRL